MVKEELNFDVIKENWSYYYLKDGSVLKVKIIVVRLFTEGTDPKGNPVLGFIATNVMGVIPSKDLINNKSIPADDDVEFEIQKEEWNEYKLDDGTKIAMKPAIAQVMRKSTLDPKGEPIYNANIQPIIKLNKK